MFVRREEERNSNEDHTSMSLGSALMRFRVHIVARSFFFFFLPLACSIVALPIVERISYKSRVEG